MAFRRSSTNGHQGLENDLREEDTVGDFKLALSYLKKDDRTAYFVVHAWSSKYDFGPGLQRSNVRGTSEKTFLDRLGFEYSVTCNVLGRGECYYKILDEVDRGEAKTSGMSGGASSAYRRFGELADNFQDIYELMHETDDKLRKAGFELPWDDLDQVPLGASEAETVYSGNQVWDFYRDFKKVLTDAESEVFVVDSYVDEDVLELYVDKLSDDVSVRIMTKNPKGKFEEIAEKFSQQRGGGVEVKTHPDCHDRLVFVDNSCYVLGQSIKDAARKPTYMIEIESFDEFKRNFETLWENGEFLLN